MGTRVRRWTRLVAVSVFGVSGGALLTGFVPNPGAQVLKQVSSIYNGELTVLEDAGHGTRYLLAQSRQGLVLQGKVDLGHKQGLAMGYYQVMALLTALHPGPARVFNMGLGGGALSRFHLARYPQSQVVSAEIDPSVIDLAKQFFFVSDARHQILEGDAFEVLKRQAGKFDVVWVDTASPKEGPKAFIPAPYLHVLGEHLSSGGLVVANLGDSKNPGTFEGVQRSYRQRYQHGIRVRTPRALVDEAPQSLAAAPSGSIAAMAPSSFVAVGDAAGLNCASFWKLYKSWKAAHTITIDWDGDAPAGVCTDL